jgi:hypothetical protein
MGTDETGAAGDKRGHCSSPPGWSGLFWAEQR